MVPLPGQTSLGINNARTGAAGCQKMLNLGKYHAMEIKKLTKFLCKKIMHKNRWFPASSSAIFLNDEASMTSRPTCIWIWSIWNDYFPYNTVCRVRCHKLLFTGEIQQWPTVNILTTHMQTPFLLIFNIILCILMWWQDVFHYENGWGEKGKGHA